MDKVIIDGVDVSECEHYRAEIETKMPYGEYETLKDKCHYSGIEVIQDCKGNKGCIYKQLKRARSKINELIDQNFKIAQKYTKLEQENERLKEENKELKSNLVSQASTIFTLEKSSNDLSQDANKLYQALQEIRDIANSRFVSGLNEEADAYNMDMQRIQTKINEVIGAE